MNTHLPRHRTVAQAIMYHCLLSDIKYVYKGHKHVVRRCCGGGAEDEITVYMEAFFFSSSEPFYIPSN